MPHLVATALTGAALALLPPVPSGLPGGVIGPEAVAAASERPAAAPRSSFRLTLTPPDGTDSRARSVTLHCEPSGGTHPHAARACADLRRGGGGLHRDPDANAICPMIYAPVVAEAKGHWRGSPMQFRQEYPSDCVMHAHTGHVFRF